MKYLASLFMLLVMAVNAAAQSCDYVTAAGSDANNASGSPYTFSSQSLGAAASDRYIVICSHGRSAVTPSITSITVAGVTATDVVTRENAGNICSIRIAAVPTGTTGDVVVTYGADMVRAAVQVYRISGIGSATASDSDSGVHATNPTVTLTAPDGCVIGCAMTSASTATEVWTGLAKDNRTGLESNTMTTSASDDATTAGSLAIDCLFNTGTTGTLVAAGWEYGSSGSAVHDPIIAPGIPSAGGIDPIISQ